MSTNPPDFHYATGDYGPYYAKVTDEHDGDTIGLDIDIGFKHSILAFNPLSGKRQFSCRLWGINAPELSTQEGKDALAWLKTVLAVGTKVVVISKDWDAYQGRYDGVVWLGEDESAASINQQMVDSGHAVYKTY